MLEPINQVAHPDGSRLLVGDDSHGYRGLREITILEWSPSGRRAKIQGPLGLPHWVEDLPYVVEVLPPPERSEVEDVALRGVRQTTGKII